jgi:SulP family sulfate permease
LRGDFTVDRLPATLATGLVMGLVNALLSVALMSLIFKGELSDALPVGVGVGLLASAVLAIAIAASSGFPGMYAGIQDSSAAILGVAAAAVATTVAAPDLADTVLAMMAVTSIATGVVFYLMATFRLGEIVRFMPFPVIGGLLAGTGYLIFDGAVDILRNGAALGDIDPVVIRGLLLPGLVFGILFFIASRRRWPSRVLLALLATGIGGFHLITQLSGVDRAASQGRGWLLGPFPEGSLWPGFVADALGGADWGALAGEAPTLVAILLIVPVTLLLYLSALEVDTESDLDSNAELRATGLANVAAGAVGGPPGHLYLADTLVAHQLLGNRRGAAVVAGISLVGVIIVGGSVLELLPQFVIGGLLLFVGLDFLVEWLWDSRNRMARLDYLLMLGIVVVIAAVGFLPGAVAGLVAAVAVFVYRYSRIDVVKHLLTGREHQSNIERPSGHAAYLQQQGDALLVLELQGFVFFGTANRIIDRVKDHVRDTPSARFVIFDFRQVTGVDSSAVALFERIALLARDQNLTLVLTGLESRAHAQFAEFAAGYADVVDVEPDLDHGTARCEDRLLEMSEAGVAPGRALPDGLEQRLGPHLVPRTFTQGERLMTQGDASPGMFLIMAGRANVLLEKDGEPPVRLRAVREGTVLGEISLYRGELCTATVVADEGCEVLHLSPEAFDELRRTDPTAAADLHLFVARTLAARVSHADRTIRSLQA